MATKAIVIISLLVATGLFLYKKNMEETVLTTGKCCEKWKEGEDKYYSIDAKYDRCGETCLKPGKALFIKIFEKGMLLAENNNPCETHGYPVSTITVSHGYPISNPSDYYEKEEPEEPKK